MSLQNKPLKPKEVLFLPAGSIGDALMMLALCAEIGELAPGARFTIIARRNAGLIRDLALAYPDIRIISIQKNMFGLLKLVWSALKRPYTVLMPGAFGKSAFLNTRNFFYLLKLRPGTQTYGLLKTAQDEDPYHASLVYDHRSPHFDNMRRLARLGSLPVKSDGSPFTFIIKEDEKYELSYKKDAYIVFHAFGSSSFKSFPPRRCRELLTLLAEKYPDLSFVLTGGKENKAEAEKMIKDIPRASLAIDLPILSLAALIKNSAFYIGVDTGPTHVAGMLHKESVVLGHNMAPSWMPTYNPNAIILTNDTNCGCDGNKGGECSVIEDGRPYLRCLYDIENSAILAAVESSLEKAGHLTHGASLQHTNL